jgi:hypothetical protein
VRYGIEISTNPCPNLVGFIFTLIKIKILDPFLYLPPSGAKNKIKFLPLGMSTEFAPYRSTVFKKGERPYSTVQYNMTLTEQFIIVNYSTLSLKSLFSGNILLINKTGE